MTSVLPYIDPLAVESGASEHRSCEAALSLTLSLSVKLVYFSRHKNGDVSHDSRNLFWK